MCPRPRTRSIGILTSGGDCPGLNAAIRSVAKAAMDVYGMKVFGIYDGFRGLVENRVTQIDNRMVSGILTTGGTILGTSRDKPHKMRMGDRVLDMTQAAIANVHRHQIDVLVCLGGGGTQKNAWHLVRQGGISVMTLPKTIDNDVPETDTTFGYDTALTIATEAIDRLHTTATSHHRIIVCEIMGHHAGWLTLGAGIAGGADVILIPEIPYDLDAVLEHLVERRQQGKRFSIIAVAEGAISKEEAAELARQAHEKAERKALKELEKKEKKEKQKNDNGESDNNKSDKKPEKERRKAESELAISTLTTNPTGTKVTEPIATRLAREIQERTLVECRVTALGHVQRGGSPSPYDRLLCTRLGTNAAKFLAEGVTNVMVAVKGDRCVPVPLEVVKGKRKLVPIDHPWLETARLVDTCLGEKKE